MNRSALPLVCGRCGRVRLWRGRVEQGPAGAAGALVGDVGDVCQAGGIVDDDLEVVVAETPAPAVAMRSGRSPEDPVATAVGDPSELLVVLVDERARVVVHVADGHARQSIGIAQAAVSRPGQDRVHGRARVAG